MRSSIVCLLLLCIPALASAEAADPNNWDWGFSVGSSYQSSGTYGTFGVRSESTDGFDPAGNDGRIIAGPKAYFGTYHNNGGEGWLGDSGFYCLDTRAPLPLQPGVSKTWGFYVWADPSMPATATWVVLAWAKSYRPRPGSMTFYLTLVSKPVGVTEGPAAGTKWDLAAQPDGGVQLPAFRTANGLKGYAFEFTATVIPEPSSFLALLAWLGGVGGMVWRRGR